MSHVRGLACLGAIVISFTGLVEGAADATVRAVTLTYAAGAECPSAFDFEAVVAGRLGYDPFVQSGLEQVLVRIERRGGAIDGRIEWRDAAGRWTGEQTFPSVSTDCSRLARAMGFALAVQIQLLERSTAASAGAGSPIAEIAPPRDGTVGPVDPPDPKSPSFAPSATLTTAATAPLAPSGSTGPEASAVSFVPTPAGPAFALGAGASVALGMSSSPVFLGRVSGSLAWPRVSVEVAALASLPTTPRRADGAGFSQHHLLGSAAVCASVTRWRGCVLANAGQVWMQGEDIDRRASASAMLFQAGARVGVTQRLGRWAFVDARADGLLNLGRWAGRLDQIVVWSAPPVAAMFGVDAGLLLP